MCNRDDAIAAFEEAAARTRPLPPRIDVRTRARDTRCDAHGWPDARWHAENCECS